MTHSDHTALPGEAAGVRPDRAGTPAAGVRVGVELLWWEGCPSTDKALAELREAMTELDLDPSSIAVREVETDEAAAREHFVGSPTIRIDGQDIQQPAETEPPSLTCRVYRLRDGRISPTPDPDDIRDALKEALHAAQHR